MSATPNLPVGGVVYPSSDGKRMAENTLQYEWIVVIKENLDTHCVGDRAAFVAGDNLIYPVEGNPSISIAPDVYVAFGRPLGHRSSYRVWEEDNVFPQVVFEIRSPSNTDDEMELKRQFYERYGANEFIDYDPDHDHLRIYIRRGRRLIEVAEVNGWVSPSLGIRFDQSGDELVIRRPNGDAFESFEDVLARAAEAELAATAARRRANRAERRAEQAEERAAQEAQRATQEAQRAAQEAQRAATAEELIAQLKAQLRAAGLDPDAAP